MASTAIHIAIAQEWAKKHKVNNIDDFVFGAVAPDLFDKLYENKNAHYGNLKAGLTLKEYYCKKVNLSSYVEQNEIVSDFNKGYFLHLVVDHFFYTQFIDLDYVEKADNKFKSELYDTYDAVEYFVNVKYNVNYNNSHKEMEYYKNKHEKSLPMKVENQIFTNQEIFDFIDKMAELDLEKIFSDIKNKSVVKEEVC